MLDARTTEAEQ